MTQLVILPTLLLLYQWACDQGKGVELIGNFLNCAFVNGVNTNNNRGLKKVVEDTGLDWLEAKKLVGQRAGRRFGIQSTGYVWRWSLGCTQF